MVEKAAKPMKRRTRWILAILILLLLPVLRLGCIMVGSDRGTITISRETTYFTEPLRSDGTVDCIAALNQRNSEGVTPENNAAVLFWKAFGPKDIDEKDHKQCSLLLGIQPPSENGDYWVSFNEFSERLEAWNKANNKGSSSAEDPPGPEQSAMEDVFDIRKGPAEEMTDTAMSRPWSSEEFPVLAQWLADNEKPFALVREGCRRPRYYDPLFRGSVRDTGLTSPLTMWNRSCGSFAETLVLHAMLDAHANQIAEAWDSLLDCHRLARLVGSGSSRKSMWLAGQIEGMACKGDCALLQHARLTPVQIAKMREDLEQLPPMPNTAERVCLCDRAQYSEIVSYVAGHGFGSIFDHDDISCTQSSDTAMSPLFRSIIHRCVDWDVVLRMGNARFDQYAAACTLSDRQDRIRAIRRLGDDLGRSPGWPGEWPRLALAAFCFRHHAVSEQVGHFFEFFEFAFIGATDDAVRRDDAAAMSLALDKLAFALAGYRAEQGSYPEKLALLVPKYVTELPKDIFNNDADLQYRREDDGYVLYSVGKNERDDGGKTREENAESDDIVVRMLDKK